ncbi:maestro heat-like repeat-containing protein family member 7 [Oenanthe melanoleuca]|uniref:maestro heat-like repeat-containing protein family member 7 n=1 Tax=Oenanthe melanoleuca TaxID=2939378 RepID=UPI0024C1B31F|nr:maestro heat-like repeat-containing protein family member 7 [Oenanthe melanoleuca]
MAGRFLSVLRTLKPLKLFRRIIRRGARVHPAQQPEEPEPSQPMQDGAAMDQTQEQEPTGGLFPGTAQEETSTMGAASMDNCNCDTTNTSAALLDMPAEEGLPSAKKVPAMVSYIHQCLMANESDEHRLDRTLLDLTEAQPTDVVMALLHVAPSCDRAAETMWKTILCSSRTAVSVQLRLLDVLENWPEHSTCTSDGDTTRVFALAATVVMWKILQVPDVPHVVMKSLPHVFVHLLFQVLFSTLDTPMEVNKFWKECQKQHGLAASPNRFAVQTLKSLLCQMQGERVVMAVGRKCGWDTLLCADTHHYAVGLLAREMSCVSPPLCSRIFRHLVQLLSTQQPRWDLPALAFIVEVLSYQKLSGSSSKLILKILSRHLRSECREKRYLALRAVLKLTDHPSLARRMCSLSERLVKLLREQDGEIVRMAVMALSFIVVENDKLIASPITLQLAEALLPLFDHDTSQVQQVSILLFQALVTVLLEKEEKTLKTQVQQSLLPLFIHCHDKNQRAAQASWETLHCAATFLERKDLKKLVKRKKLWKFAECLLAEDRSRAAEHLRQALPYLRSPQEPLRDAAIRFIGMAGWCLRGQEEELQIICEALEYMADDSSPASYKPSC